MFHEMKAWAPSLVLMYIYFADFRNVVAFVTAQAINGVMKLGCVRVA